MPTSQVRPRPSQDPPGTPKRSGGLLWAWRAAEKSQETGGAAQPVPSHPGGAMPLPQEGLRMGFYPGGPETKKEPRDSRRKPRPRTSRAKPTATRPHGDADRHGGLSAAFLPLPGVRPREGISPAPGLPGSFLAAGAGSVPLPDTGHLLHSHHRPLSSSWKHRTVSWVRDWGCTSKHVPRGTCSPKKPSVGSKARAPQPLWVALLYTSSLKALKRPAAKTHPYTV